MGGMFFLTSVLGMLASTGPMLFGVSKVNDQSSLGDVALLSLLVYLVQIALGVLVGFLLTGWAGLTMLSMLFSLEIPISMYFWLLVGAIVSYLGVFAILAWIYLTFVDDRATT
jgi:heme A synthase